MTERKLPRRDFLRIAALLGAKAVLDSAKKGFLGRATEALTANAETVAIPEAKMINGIETYGHDEPLTNAQLIALRDYLNQKFLAGENQRPENGMTATALVWAEEYNGEYAIHEKTGHQDFQDFARSHHEKMDEILKTQTNLSDGATLRRVIVIADDAEVSLGYSDINNSQTIMDSNALVGVWFHRPYDPTLSTNYLMQLMIDAGYLHEEGHYQLPGMPDFYALDGYFDQVDFQVSIETVYRLLNNILYLQRISNNSEEFELILLKLLQQSSQETPAKISSNSSNALSEMPQDWLQYIQSLRDDDRGGMWSGQEASLLLGRHEKAFLNRRIQQGKIHDRVSTYAESGWDFVSEFATKHVLKVSDQENPNRWIAGPGETVDYQIYQTYTEEFYANRFEKKFTEEPTYSGQVVNGEFALNTNPFEKGVERFEFIHEDGLFVRDMIPNTNGLLMLRVQKRDASGAVIDQGWRYMDVNDFSVGYWENGASLNTCFELSMKFNLGNANVSPAELQWEIEYEAAGAEHSNFLPLVVDG